MTENNTATWASLPAVVPTHVDVLQRLEGDFPGGVAHLHYRFTLDGGMISRLVIEP